MTDDTRDLTGARWSSAVRCARRAVYEHQRAPRGEYPRRLKDYFLRGQVWDAHMGAMIADEYAADGVSVEVQVTVPWPHEDPFGTGHADVLVNRTTIKEVTTHADNKVQRIKCLQGAGYALEHPTAIAADLITIDPNTGRWTEVPIDVEALKPEVDAIQGAVYAGIHFGVLPERVGADPDDAACYGCPFKAHCWHDWQTPPDEVISGRAQAALDRYLQAKARVDAMSEVVKLREGEAREAKADLMALVPLGRKVMVGDRPVNRVRVSGHRSLSLADAEAAGHSLPDNLKPFLRESEDYEQVYISKPRGTT